MTKQEIEALKYQDIICCPFTSQKWYVDHWMYDNRKNIHILIVKDMLKSYYWYLTKDQLKRYIIIKKSSFYTEEQLKKIYDKKE